MRRRSSVSPTSAHSIDGSRILNTITCLDRAYTGYIDVEARHHFFYFFESRRDPGNGIRILWRTLDVSNEYSTLSRSCDDVAQWRLESYLNSPLVRLLTLN